MSEIKIETFTDGNAETRFRVVAANGQTTMTPHEGYSRPVDCHRAIVDNFAAIIDAVMHVDGLLVVDEDGTRHRLVLRREADGTISLELQE